MQNKKIRVGVFGAGRGSTFCKFCKEPHANAQLVAVCDFYQPALDRAREDIADDSVTYYPDFTSFIAHDMDAVILANFANEHAPFAIKAMEAGKDVVSEVLPVQNMAEAVALIECIERTGRKYCYAENYCYLAGTQDMKRRYRAGELGEFAYGEGEYIHNCEPIWPELTYGDPNHWRNNMNACFYCTHSAGPLIHITGMRPVKVVGIELPFDARQARMGSKSGVAGIEIATLENGSVIKSIHGGLAKNSVWYTIYGSKGKIEVSREIGEPGDHTKKVYANLEEEEGQWKNEVQAYTAEHAFAHLMTDNIGHGGSDFTTSYHIYSYMQGNAEADVIDVYEALDMWMIGHFAYLSVLDGGIPKEIPDLRIKEAREQYRNDYRCTDPKVAGDQLLPTYSKGTPSIDPKIYDGIRKRWEEQQKQ